MFELDWYFGTARVVVLAIPPIERFLHWAIRSWVGGPLSTVLSNLGGLFVVLPLALLATPPESTGAFLFRCLLLMLMQLLWFVAAIGILTQRDDGRPVSLRYGLGRSLGWLSGYLAICLLLTYPLLKDEGIPSSEAVAASIGPSILLGVAAVFLFRNVAAKRFRCPSSIN